MSILIQSGDDASEGVQRQRKSFVHVLAQACVALLAQIVFGPHRLLDAVSRVQARGHLDATTQSKESQKTQIGTVLYLVRDFQQFSSAGIMFCSFMVFSDLDLSNKKRF